MSNLDYKDSPTLGTVQTVLGRNKFQNQESACPAPQIPPAEAAQKTVRFQSDEPGKNPLTNWTFFLILTKRPLRAYGRTARWAWA